MEEVQKEITIAVNTAYGIVNVKFTIIAYNVCNVVGRCLLLAQDRIVVGQMVEVSNSELVWKLSLPIDLMQQELLDEKHFTIDYKYEEQE